MNKQHGSGLAKINLDRRHYRVTSTVTGVRPAALWMRIALEAGQCHTLYMMPMRLHGVTPSA